MIDLGPFVRPGDGIWWGQAAAEPRPLVHALLDQVAAIGPVRAFCGLTSDERLSRELPVELAITSYGALGSMRRLSRAGRLDVVPCNYSALPRLFAERRLPCDVGFLQVAPPDEHGNCSLGIGVDYVADAIAHTPTLIAEINDRMPVTPRSVTVPLRRFSAVVATSRELVELPEDVPDDVDSAIARNVADLVANGDTIQLGVGSLPAAVVAQLTQHADLGVHSGMISDGMLRLIDAGVVNGRHKEIDRGIVVTGTAIGSTDLYDRIADYPIRFQPASYTHSPATLSQLRSFVSVNSALEVDLSGQVGSEIGSSGAYIGAVGGQVDFSHAAATTGARSIIALRSTFDGSSTIRPHLRGVVTTSRSDVDIVVTEFGAAHLRGADLSERARRLVEIAAPEHREELHRAVADWKLAG